ncbi:MAG: hypothetical protein JWQ87_1291 [Candidatus Sulfotelmatobacter sp.]|nr:hypothetical protein [Candidatus Sulfotelmatobacter sp.]
MRTNNMTLAKFETFVVRLACGFASVVFLLLVLLIAVGFAESSLARESEPNKLGFPAKPANYTVSKLS